ncbi:MAG: hypothetical protein AAGF58_14720 [Pseudomonadota bacterium]
MKNSWFLRLGAISLSAALLTACASGTYEPPAVPAVTTATISALEPDGAINRIVDGAAGLGFEVRDVDRQQGVISLAFGQERPRRYVDCGTYDGTTGQTSFSGNWINWVTTSRRAQLTGLMEVTVAPTDDGQSFVSVRAGYALTLPASIAPGFAGADFAFASDTTDTVDIIHALEGGRPKRTCGPSGEAERQILDLV